MMKNNYKYIWIESLYSILYDEVSIAYVSKKFTDDIFLTLVASHFNESAHNMSHFSLMPIDIINNNVNHLCNIQTLHTKALNS